MMTKTASMLKYSLNKNPGWKKPFLIIWSGQVFLLLGSGLVQFALV